MKRLFLGIVVVLLVGRAVWAEGGDSGDSEAMPLLKQAFEHDKDPAALEKDLAAVDAVIARAPKDAIAHYARGWVLSRLRRVDPSVAAYDRAFELDGKLADAAYNAGVVLADAGKRKEAIVRFDRAFTADPTLVDAAYNAGQAHYDLRDFAKAEARWKAAEALAPEDFQIAKKLVQANVALGRDAQAAKARDKVFALWKAGKDPNVAKLKSYVYDQFDVGKYHIYVHEIFDTSGDLAYVYRFDVTLNEKTIGSINLETSAVIREQGVPFVLGMDKGGTHTTLGKHTWKSQPAYKAVKAIAAKEIAANF